MPETDSPEPHDELAETIRQVAEENAGLHALVERSAEFAHRQPEAFAAITQMADALTLNEGLAKDRAFLAATLAILSEACAASANTRMVCWRHSMRCDGPLQLARAIVRSPWPFMVSVHLH